MNNLIIRAFVLVFSPIIISLFSSCKKNMIPATNIETTYVALKPIEYEIDSSNLIWEDDFLVDGKPDSAKWSYDLGGHGWGNQELQNYTNSEKNAYVKDGLLNITAIKENSGTNKYSSTRLVSKNKGDFLYGRIEVKAKLPVGVGTWPAIWMLATEQVYGNQYWPDNGEIDIMEHVGFDQDVVHGNVHTKAFNHGIGTNKGDRINVPKASESFNVYAVNWFPNKIVFEINDKEYFVFTKNAGFSWEEWPFDKKFHVILNIAIGGAWGGQKGVQDNIFPQSLEVDYVKVYGIKEKK